MKRKAKLYVIYVNVYKLFNETAITYRIAKVKNAEHHINLLMIEEEDNHHYVLIKDLSKLIGCQYNKQYFKKDNKYVPIVWEGFSQ